MMSDDPTSSELHALLVDYQDVVRRGDRAGFARIYHPSANISYRDRGRLVLTSAADFADEVAVMVEAGQVVDERSRSVEISAGESVATMRVEFDLQLADEYFRGTDFYTLVRFDEGWRIVQKVYEMTPLAAS